MKKRMSFLMVIVLIMSCVFVACGGGGYVDTSNGGDENNDGGDAVNSTTVTKYEANQYTGNDKIKYSYTYENYNFYYIYLGELINIPIFYYTSSYHTGINFKYTFSITNITENLISKTVSDSTQTTNSIINEHSYTSGGSQMVGLEISTKYGIGILNGEIKAKGELSWDQHTTDANTTGFEETTSLTNTKEYATTTAYSTMESREWNLTKEDKVGYYRCTMFSPSDVYLYVIKDSDTGELYYEFKECIIPDSYFWTLDYSETASFRKNDTTNFELDLSILDSLPEPDLDFSEKPELKAPVISVQPSNITMTEAGGNATFKVDAYGFPELSYQWQVSTNGGLNWNNVANAGIYSGAVTAILALTNITVAYSGYQYRCIISNLEGTLTSKAVTLTVGIKATPMIAAGEYHTVALKSDGTVWAWGRNNYGQLGNGTTTDHSVPIQVKGVGGSGYLTGIVAIAAGNYYTVALKWDGTVWAWGINSGALGDGTTTNRYTPIQVKGVGGSGYLTSITAIAAGTSHVIALKTDGTVWGWGANGSGALGDGTTTSYHTPVQVKDSGGLGYLTNITGIAAGNHSSFAIKSNGTVWAWGSNNSGKLGDGTFTDRSVPVQVKGAGGSGYLTGIIAIAAGFSHTVALKKDGTVWAWGYNYAGTLGTGDSIIEHYTPVQVKGAGGSGYLTGIIAIATGSGHIVALKSDGTVWTWGYNNNGQLGDGTTTDRTAPVQAKDASGLYLTNIISITAGGSPGVGTYYTLAIKSDGTILACGSNRYGQLGDGTKTDSSVLIRVKGASGVGYLTLK